MNNILYNTGRLVVRKWRTEDAADLFAYCSDKTVTKFLTFPTYKSIDDAHERLRFMQEVYTAYEGGDESAFGKMDFAVALKETDRVIGSIGWVGFCKLAGGIIELGALLSREFQGKGFMTEALRGMFGYIKTEGLAKRIEAKHDVENSLAGANLKRAGMTFEGVRRMCITNNRTPRADSAVYSILAEEINGDLDKAKKMLEKDKSLTCVLVKGKTVYTSTKPGVAPMLEFIDNKLDLKGFAAADKVVGKAAAMLFVSAGVREVDGTVMSESAVEIFESLGTVYSCGSVVENIRNRRGDGVCPMEKAVSNVKEPNSAHGILKEEVRKMKENSSMKGVEASAVGTGAFKPKPLGFGCMRMPVLDENDVTSFDYDTICKMFDNFIANGFTHFDTAYVYHRGESENMLKRCLTSRYSREKFQLSDKLPIWRLEKKEDMAKIFGEQLAKCGVEYFDYYLMHSLNADSYKICKNLGAFDFGREMRRQGKIKKLGFSFHHTPELLDEILTANPDVDFVLLQINYFDWNNPGVQSRRCWEVVRKHNKPLMVMEPVKGGNLANVPADAEKLMKKANPELSVPSWGIRYAASLDGVFMVLSGMSAPEQVEDNISYMKNFKPLSDSERDMLKQVVQILNAQNTIACTQCGYCLDGCPKRIAIPSYFALYNSLSKDKDSNLSSQWAYYNNIITEHGKASDCIECRACEGVCPQHLEISRLLRNDVVDVLEKKNYAPSNIRKRK